MEVLIPLAPFIMVIAIVVIPAWLKSRERRDMQETVRKAIEKGQALPPELIESLSAVEIKSPPSAAKDMRVGVILLAVSLGIALLAQAMAFIESEALYPILGAAAIPGAIGLAFVILSFFNKNKD